MLFYNIRNYFSKIPEKSFSEIAERTLWKELSLPDNFMSAQYTLYTRPFYWCYQLSTWLLGLDIFKEVLIIIFGISCQKKSNSFPST